jgi:uncharacterized membrane protein YqjE
VKEGQIMGTMIIGRLTFFFGQLLLIGLLATIVISLWPDPVAIAIVAGGILGIPFGLKWAKQEYG